MKRGQARRNQPAPAIVRAAAHVRAESVVIEHFHADGGNYSQSECDAAQPNVYRDDIAGGLGPRRKIGTADITRRDDRSVAGDRKARVGPIEIDWTLVKARGTDRAGNMQLGGEPGFVAFTPQP